jgi:hypothetical protein
MNVFEKHGNTAVPIEKIQQSLDKTRTEVQRHGEINHVDQHRARLQGAD